MLYKKLLLLLFFSLSSPLPLPYEKMTAEILTLSKKEYIWLFKSAEKNWGTENIEWLEMA